MAKYKLKQKPHNGQGLYYFESGKYYGFDFVMTEDQELICETDDKSIEPLVKAGVIEKVK
jgi:hypothetical protein